MNKRILRVMLALLLCVATLAIALPSTVAYMASRSNTVRNIFRVQYLPPQDVTVPVRIHKTVLCSGNEAITPEGFTFLLENLETGNITPMTTPADGLAATTLRFTADDVDQCYHYRLYEQNDGRENVIYDTIVYDITIALRLNEQHEMEAELTVNGQPVTELVATFVNRYAVAVVPNTGDSAQPLLWLGLLVGSLAGLLLCWKQRVLRRP